MDTELKNILEKVNCLYRKYGIKSVTMDDVARELGISKKTLYQHVKDKNELVEKAIDLELEQKNCRMQQIDYENLNAIEEIFEVNRCINQMIKEYNPSLDYDLRKYYPDLHKKIQEIRLRSMSESVLANLRKGKKEGLYREELNEEIITKLQVARLEKSLHSEIFTIEEVTSPKFHKEVFIYHIMGIANEKGRKFLENNIDKLNINE